MARCSEVARNDAIVLHAADDVATALRDLAAGEVVEVRIGDRAERVTLAEPIALCHKFALHALSPGQAVRKYGEVIGRATAAVERGAWVHVHNLKSLRARPPGA
jgi:altronate dehydratase small subunit